jgi:spore coat polysaccharide biosynthesis predicted glycosyltransferase SpsG
MTIANECRMKNMECIFLLADNEYESLVKERGFLCVVLDVEWNDWNSSIKKVQEAVDQYSITKLVVDSYVVTAQFLNTMNQMVPVIYLDDFCNEKYNIAGVIHYSQWPEENTLQVLYRNTDTKILAGMKYVPLRQEFMNVEKNTTHMKKQIMITTGGTDPYHISLKVAERFLCDDEFRDYTLLAVLGCMNQDEAVFREMEANNARLSVKVNVNNMAELMKTSIAAVSAGGTTVYEFCACKIPVVSFAFSEDHVEFEKKFERRGMMLYSGDARYEENVVDNIIENLKRMLHDDDLRRKSIEGMSELVDGQGARRIVDEILT